MVYNNLGISRGAKKWLFLNLIDQTNKKYLQNTTDVRISKGQK